MTLDVDKAGSIVYSPGPDTIADTFVQCFDNALDAVRSFTSVQPDILTLISDLEHRPLLNIGVNDPTFAELDQAIVDARELIERHLFYFCKM